MSSKEQRNPSISAMLSAVLLIGAGTLLTLFFGALILVSASDGKTIESILWGLTLVSVLQIPLGVGLLLGRRWAGPATLLIGLGLGVWTVYAELMVLAAPALWAVDVMVLIPYFEVGKHASRSRNLPQIPRRVLVSVTLFAALIALLYIGRKEIRSTLWDLRYTRWQERCEEDGDSESCGRYAMHAVRDGRTFEELRRGRDLFDTLCDQKIPRACRFGGWIRSEYQHNWFIGDDSWFDEERARRANQACEAGNARGCLVSMLYKDGTSEAYAAAHELCVAGDALACFASTHHDDRPRACEAGFSSRCERFPIPPTACTDGDWAVCHDETITGVEGEVRDALAALRWGDDDFPSLMDNPGLYLVSLPVHGLDATCKEGNALACFALGLNATADMNPFEYGAVPQRSLDITWGKSCDLGMNAACYAYAVRLLDRPFDEKNRQEERANELLTTACDRGHVHSCWLQALELTDPSKEIDRVRTAAENACRNAVGVRPAPCLAWADILAADIEATPWRLSNAEGYHHLREACRQGKGHRSCTSAALLVQNRSDESDGISVAPLWVQSASIAEFSCRGSWPWACFTLFEAAKRWEHLGLTSEAELRQTICPQVPEACED